MDLTQKQLEFLKNNDLFRGLSIAQLEQISALLQELQVEAGETIIHENEISEDIYIIEEGEVEISKIDSDTGYTHTLAKLGQGAIVGEISMLDNEPRSASVITTKPSKFFILSIKHLESLGSAGNTYLHLADKISLIGNQRHPTPSEPPAYFIILQNIAIKLGRRMRTANEAVIEGLKKELAQTKARVAMGRVIVYTLSLISFYILLLQFSKLFHFDLISTSIVSIPLIGIFALALFIMMKQSGYPLSLYGLTLSHWRTNIKEALIFTIPLLILTVVLKWILVEIIPSYSGLSLFSFTEQVAHIEKSVDVNFFLLLLYIIFVPLQELIVRGALQSSLQELLIGPQKTILAIALSNLLFGITHLHISIELALMAAIPGLFWGWMYARQRSLVGVSVSHILLGVWALFVVGFGF